jgi:phenylacetic acid degradation operon negative regulatory protein
LWTVGAWVERATALLDAFGAATRPAETFTVAAAIVRHLGTDPVLPEQLLPGEWPGGHLRDAYAKYQREVMALAVNRGRC